jgi:hypothetical protein
MKTNHPPGERSSEEYLNNRLYEFVINWVNHVGSHLLLIYDYPIHILFYERLKTQFATELDSLSKFLEIALSGDDISAIKEKVDFDIMKIANPHHLYKGNSFYWPELLSDTQFHQVNKIAGPLLKLINYRVDENPQSGLPELDPSIKREELVEAIKHCGGTFFDQFVYAYYFLKSKRSLSEKIIKGSQYLFRKFS